MASRREHLKALAAALIVFGGCWLLGKLAWRELTTVQQGFNVSREEVTFLKLPPSASNIDYWNMSRSFLRAEFTIPEEEFTRLFNEFQFQEIQEPVYVSAARTIQPTDPTEFRNGNITISKGLHYIAVEISGRGYDITFNRDTSRGYFHYNSR